MRLHGHRLRPGTYTIGEVVIRAGKRSQVGKLGVRVHATRAERIAFPAQSCEQASAFVSGLPELLGAGTPPSRPAAVPPAGGAACAQLQACFQAAEVAAPVIRRPRRRTGSVGVLRRDGLARWRSAALTEFARKQWAARG